MNILPVDPNIAASAFDCLGREPLVGGGLLQMVSGGSERGIALDVLAEELLTGKAVEQDAHGWILSFGSAERGRFAQSVSHQMCL